MALGRDTRITWYGHACVELTSPGGKTVLIDGGPSGTWKKSLKPRLEELRQARGDDFRIDLLMVSHIDDDHIVGVVDFTGEWVAAVDDEAEWPFPVAQLWHNSFERISDSDVWVLPNPSGLNAHYQLPQLAAAYAELLSPR